MKHKEIDVWYSETRDAVFTEAAHKKLVNDDSISGVRFFLDGTYKKAKLIIPVEPEVVEFESVAKRLLKLEAGSGNSAVCVYPSEEINDKLAGRRWKCRFEEVVE